MNRTLKQIIGDDAEQQARTFLESRGLSYIESNFSIKQGEIDLIMRDQDYLVFIEVRWRERPHYGDSLESITPTKQRRIIKTAEYYLQQKKSLNEEDCRFDVIGFDQQGKIIWIKNAFEVQ